MRRKRIIEFTETATPILEAVTKFGGQPVWLDTPRWPLSRSYGTPMQFICQIELYPELFGCLDARMAYIFLAADGSAGPPPKTFLPDAGENAVVLQPASPGCEVGLTVSTTTQREGPSLFKQEFDPILKQWRERPCEYAVTLTEGEDPDTFDFDISKLATEIARDSEQWAESQKTILERYTTALFEDKIGGTPVPPDFGDPFPYPEGGPWRLILQLSEDDERFLVNFGTDGIGYALISEDGMRAKFLWQRP